MTDEHVPRTTVGDTIDHVVGRVTAGVVDWLFRGVLGAPLVVDQLGRFADGDQTSSDVVAVQAVFGTTFLLLGVMQGLLGWTPGRWLVRHRVIVDDGEDHPRGVIEYPEPPGLRIGLVRTLPSLAALALLYVGPLAVILAIANLVYILWDPARRSLHDRVAGTLVLRIKR